MGSTKQYSNIGEAAAIQDLHCNIQSERGMVNRGNIKIVHCDQARSKKRYGDGGPRLG